MAAEVFGDISHGFESILDIFKANFIERNELGAACCIYYEGKKVVDIWGGLAVEETKVPWNKHTIVNVFSSTKFMTNVCIMHLVDKGLLHYDDKISKFWPEFGSNNKENITLSQLLSHQAGLSYIDNKISKQMILDAALPNSILEKYLAEQAPIWTFDGQQHGYSPMMVGLYVSQIVRRVDEKHRNLSTYFYEEIALPYDIEFYMGLPSSFNEESRLSKIYSFDPNTIGNILVDKTFEGASFFKKMLDKTSITSKAWNNLDFQFDSVDPITRTFEMPSTVGITNARAMAKLANILALGGNPLLSNSNVMIDATTPAVTGIDCILNIDRGYTRGGFIIHPTYKSSFFHYGSGGSVCWVDPKYKLAFGFTMNRIGVNFDEPRRKLLIDAVYNIIFKK